MSFTVLSNLPSFLPHLCLTLSIRKIALLVFYLVVDDRGTVDSCALSFQMCLWQIRKVELSDDRASVKQMNPETCVQPSKSVGGNDRGRVIQWDDAAQWS